MQSRFTNTVFVALLICTIECSSSILGTPERAAWVSRSWRVLHRLDPHEEVVLTVALRQRNVDRLREIALSVSDPLSKSYGQHLSIDELHSLVAPSQSSVAAVTSYFDSLGAHRIERVLTDDFLRVWVRAGALESALGVRLHAFAHHKSGRVLFRTLDAYALPDSVAKHIDVLTGLHDFMAYPSERRRRTLDGIPLALRSSSSVSNNSSPFIQRVVGSSSRIDIEVIPYCAGGVPTNNTQQWCADSPPALSQIQLLVIPQHYDPQLLVVTPYNVSCVANTAGAGVVCHVIAHVPPLTRTLVGAQAFFSDSSASPEYLYPVLHAPSPYSPPSAIQQLYNVPAGTTASLANNSQSVVSFEAEEQYYSERDLQQFFDLMGLPQSTPVVHGNNNVSNPGPEATLDIQYIMSTGRGVPTVFWSVPGPFGNGGYILEWALEISNTSSPPLVTSISYGDTELGYYNFYGSWAYIQRMETELAKMAARGMTVCAGSGDAGASNVGEDGNDLSPEDPTCTPLRPFYPSNSAFVVSVSATFLGLNTSPFCSTSTLLDDPVICDRVGEIAVGLSQGTYWTTGGGFSNVSWNTRPSWQSTAVQQYLTRQQQKDQLPPSSIWAIGGRAYPDISAIGYNVPIVYSQQIWPIGGTSASGPIFAGLVALLNEHRLAHALPPVGHLSPLLYLLAETCPTCFNDVLVGDNVHGDLQARGSSFPQFCQFGFFADTGYDAVSGLGTANFAELRKHINDYF